MMHARQPSDADKINLDRAHAESDRQIERSRRTRALLSAAAEDGSRKAWHVVKVAPNRENDVDKSLSAHLIEHWLPLVKADANGRGGRAGFKGASFWVLAWPGYLFVRVADTARAWAGLACVKHVVSVLGADEHPFPVGDDMLLKIKAELATLKAVGKNADVIFARDEAVRVTDGPFASFPGTIVEMGANGHEGRALVEVMLFGRIVPVELELAHLAKAQ